MAIDDAASAPRNETLAGRSAVVSGAGSGIGRAVSERLARNGAAVIAFDLDGAAAEATARAIVDAGGAAEAFVGDVTQEPDIAGSIAAAERLGRFSIAVNNAGIIGAEASVDAYPVEAWSKIIAVNLTAVFLALRAQLPAIERNGGGAVVNTASMAGTIAFADFAGYVASKHGVVGLTKTAALEFATRGVRVNAVGPAFVRTPLVENALSSDVISYLESMHPIGRLVDVDEVANLAAFLAGDEASGITGSLHLVDGGYTAA